MIAEPGQSRIVCRENITQSQREDLANKLRRITGWTDLTFERNGLLRLGNKTPVGGSLSARALLEKATLGSSFIVIEDASKHAEVAFARVIPGMWKDRSRAAPPAFVIQIDFADFKHVLGDSRALQSFDAGWALLHELDHVVNDSVDAVHPSDEGVCESHINQMRRECGLPQRTDYFFSYLPLADAGFNTKLVRLAFEQADDSTSNKRRYWLVWDAKLVGGLVQDAKIAALR